MSKMSIIRGTVLGAAIAVGVAPVGAMPVRQDAEVASAVAVSRAVYNQKKGALMIIGTGFDANAVVRVNGVEVQGERKFRSDKNKLRIKIPAAELGLKATGQNTIEIAQGSLSSGEIAF